MTDLDNTLWDWFAIWYASFSALLEQLVAISGVDRSQLEDEIRVIHQARGTSEYSYLVQELPTLQARYPGQDLAEVMAPAIHAYRSERKRVMALYPGVLDSLLSIKKEGTRLIAYTESLAYYTSYRLRALGLDGVIDVLYSPRDHDFPSGVTPEALRTLPSDEYELASTEHRHTPPGLLKPEKAVLEAIVSEMVKGDPTTVAYVGDSLMKDVAMAQAVGVADVYAKYGAAQQRPEYELLQRVSHWTEDDVERERQISAQPNLTPTYVLEHSFAEITDLFTFVGR